jgi:hypothetical protein
MESHQSLTGYAGLLHSKAKQVRQLAQKSVLNLKNPTFNLSEKGKLTIRFHTGSARRSAPASAMMERTEITDPAQREEQFISYMRKSISEMDEVTRNLTAFLAESRSRKMGNLGRNEAGQAGE